MAYEKKVTEILGYWTDYSSDLEKVLPEWWQEASQRQRECLVSIVNHLRCVDNAYGRDDLFIIESQLGEKLGYCRKTWQKVIEGCGLFTVFDSSYSKVRKKAKLYRFTELGQEFLRSGCDHTTENFDPILELTYGGEYMKLRYDKIPKRVWKRSTHDFEITCQLNYKMLESLLGLEEETDPKNKHRSNPAQLLYNRLKRTDGKFIQLYKRISSGRLYGMKNMNLQNLPKFVRERLFAGHYDVDMVNAHYTLAFQLYSEKYRREPEFIGEYVRSRSAVRQILARDLGIDVDSIKKALLALLYGAGRDPGVGENNPFVLLMGLDKAHGFLQHDFVQGLAEDIDNLIEILKPELSQIILTTKLKIPSLSSALAFKLQRIESEILDLCIQLYEPKALYFDGFITQEDVDTEVLESYVAANSDYWMNFESNLLEIED